VRELCVHIEVECAVEIEELAAEERCLPGGAGSEVLVRGRGDLEEGFFAGGCVDGTHELGEGADELLETGSRGVRGFRV